MARLSLPATESTADRQLPQEWATCAACGSPFRGSMKVRLANSRLMECAVCRVWLYVPRPCSMEQVAIHDSVDYFEHPYFGLRRTAQLAIDRRCRWVFQRIAAAQHPDSLRGQRLLDVGCDTGAFLLSAARQFGVVPVGIDVARKAVEVASSGGIEVYRATIENAPESLQDFPVVTAVDLIEHVADPRGFLREIRRRLRPGGAVYLETPNICSAVYRTGRLLCNMTGGRPWRTFERLFPPQHIQYFTMASLRRMAVDSGLEVVQIDNRMLPWDDIAAPISVRIAMAALQAADGLTGDRILICAVLRRPVP